MSKMAANETRPFHAFISYAEQDREWVKKKLIKNLEQLRKLKLFVASCNFEAGRLISANIHSAITKSNKTVFVISKSFLKSSWCLEEFSMALTVSIAHSSFYFGQETNQSRGGTKFSNFKAKIGNFLNNYILTIRISLFASYTTGKPICILSPNITMEDIQYPEMRKVLNNVTYLRWPPKPSLNVPISAVSKKHSGIFGINYTQIL